MAGTHCVAGCSLPHSPRTPLTSISVNDALEDCFRRKRGKSGYKNMWVVRPARTLSCRVSGLSDSVCVLRLNLQCPDHFSCQIHLLIHCTAPLYFDVFLVRPHSSVNKQQNTDIKVLHSDTKYSPSPSLYNHSKSLKKWHKIFTILNWPSPSLYNHSKWPPENTQTFLFDKTWITLPVWEGVWATEILTITSFVFLHRAQWKPPDSSPVASQQHTARRSWVEVINRLMKGRH
jgi:hypothetical protein